MMLVLTPSRLSVRTVCNASCRSFKQSTIQSVRAGVASEANGRAVLGPPTLANVGLERFGVDEALPTARRPVDAFQRALDLFGRWRPLDLLRVFHHTRAHRRHHHLTAVLVLDHYGCPVSQNIAEDIGRIRHQFGEPYS